MPTAFPTRVPTRGPSTEPSSLPTSFPSNSPTSPPSRSGPTAAPSTSQPTVTPSASPTALPTIVPTTLGPTEVPTTAMPTGLPTASPSTAPAHAVLSTEDDAEAGLSSVAEVAVAIGCTAVIVIVLLTLTWRLSDPRRGTQSLSVEAALWDRGVRLTTNPVYDRSAISPKKASAAKVNRNRGASTVREHYATPDVEETFDEPVSAVGASPL